MKRYTYYDLDGECILTEEEILEEYFKYWSCKMTEVGRAHLINKKSCIEDWIVLHWATEVK